MAYNRQAVGQGSINSWLEDLSYLSTINIFQLSSKAVSMISVMNGIIPDVLLVILADGL